MNAPESTEPRWRRRPEDRPTEILSAALDVFAEQGLAGARVEDIAARAGVSKGTVYLYFSGKEELFREAVLEKVHRTLSGLQSAVPPGDPTERLLRFVDAYWAHLRRPAFPPLYRLVMGELHKFPELTRFFAEQVSGKVIAWTADIIRDGIEQGRFRKMDPLVASRMIVGLLVQHAVWAGHPGLFPHLGNRKDETLVCELKDFLLSAVAAPDGATGPGSP